MSNTRALDHHDDGDRIGAGDGSSDVIVSDGDQAVAARL
jgi:hypothetical protein